MKLPPIPALDGLRAVAVLLVLAFHCRATGRGDALSGGFVGVDVFFVLSGFLITSILMSEVETAGRIDLLAFYARRARRLMPALGVLLTAYLALCGVLWSGIPFAVHLRDALTAATYTSNYSRLFFGPPVAIGHTWSLAIEEQYYLLWPLVLPLALATRRPAWLLGGLWIAETVARAVLAVRGSGWDPLYHDLETHSTGLLLGGLAAFLPPGSPKLALAGLFGLAVCAARVGWGDQNTLVFGLPLAEVSSAAILLGVVNGEGVLAHALSRPALRWIGAVSYGVYLWHYPIARLVRDALPWWQTFALVAPLSFALAAASYYTVEAAFRPRRSRPGPARVQRV